MLAGLAGCINASALEHDPDAMLIDGELDEPVWNTTAVRGVFAGDGGEAIARPYSEVRAFVRGDAVYVGLYAADEDIESTDRFELTVGTVAVSLSAAGSSSDARVRAGVDRDGTLDDPRDDDEEWVVEAALPVAALGAPPWALRASRCDTTHAGHRHCGSWSTVLTAR
nr:hypothetical protein [Kofleriaceae bacterium]